MGEVVELLRLTRNLAQNGTLVRNTVGEDGIVGRDAVRDGHEEGRVIDLVKLPHLATARHGLILPTSPSEVRARRATYTAT
jgi:hypothetical protein